MDSAISAPDALPVALLQLRKQVHDAHAILLTFTSILIWDCLSLVRREYSLIWKQRWSLMKVLYLLNRYVALVAAILACLFANAPIPQDICRKNWWMLLVIADFVIVVCDAILVVRVHALYERSRFVLGILIVLWLVEIGVLVRAAFEPRPFILPTEIAKIVEFNGCLAMVPPERAVQAAFLGWAPTLVMNIIIFVMILWRSVAVRLKFGVLPLHQQIQNDGAMYFISVVSINTIALGFAAQSRPVLQATALPALLAIMSIACNRLILSLRSRKPEVKVINSCN